MRIKVPQDVSQVESWEELRRYVAQVLPLLTQVINGQVDLVDNASTSLVTATFPSANQELAVGHRLKRIPQGYLIVGTNSSFSVFDGVTDNSSETIYLRASAAGTARVLVF